MLHAKLSLLQASGHKPHNCSKWSVDEALPREFKNDSHLPEVKCNLQAILAVVFAVFGVGSCFGDQNLNFLY